VANDVLPGGVYDAGGVKLKSFATPGWDIIAEYNGNKN